LGSIEQTAMTSMKFVVKANYTLYRSTEDPDFVLFTSNQSIVDQSVFEKAKPTEASKLTDFRAKSRMILHWSLLNGMIVQNKIIIFEYCFVFVLPLDIDPKHNLIVLPMLTLPAGDFFKCNTKLILATRERKWFTYDCLLEFYLNFF